MPRSARSAYAISMARSSEIAGFDGLPHLPLAAAGLDVGGGGGLCSGGGSGLVSTGGGGGLCSGRGAIPSKPSMFAFGVEYGIGFSVIWL